MKLDKIDVEILRFYNKNGKQSLDKIKTHILQELDNDIASQTISNRIKKLIDQKLLQNFSIHINFAMMNYYPIIFKLSPLTKAKKYLDKTINHAFTKTIYYEQFNTNKEILILTYFKNHSDYFYCIDELTNQKITVENQTVFNIEKKEQFKNLLE